MAVNSRHWPSGGHDRAPCMKALTTQAVLRNNQVDFFGNDEWPGSSTDLNACENLGAILKDRVSRRPPMILGIQP